jgi:O-antigen/teichoic acid export membrane protein
MTTKVVKGSLWTISGQVLPLAVSLITTPFVIRYLGAEQYGLLILVGLIPAYFGFADLGMGMASTKFGAEAYGDNNAERESDVVRTTAWIALIGSAPVALLIFFLSDSIIGLLNVADHLRPTASTGLKISAIAFVFGILSSVMNTPQLSRLRMDLNTLAGAVPKVIYTIALPLLLYFGFGIIGAVTGMLIAAMTTVFVHIYFSGRLLPELSRGRWNKKLLKPIFRFSSGWVIGSIAAVLLVHFEKLALTKMLSVDALAYYSVAFMFANLTSTFSTAMMQALVPAFSQLLGPKQKPEFDRLFARSVRLNLVWLLPMIMIMIVIGRPFLTLWAGPEFGIESTVPFYILLGGLFFNILACIPHSTIIAHGRIELFAKLYWMELVLYIVLVPVLVYYFGIIGAAMAWSFRVFVDCFLIIWISRRVAGVHTSFSKYAGGLLVGTLILLVPVAFAILYDNFSVLLFPLVGASLVIYLFFVWKMFLAPDEKDWVKRISTPLFS